MDRNIAEQLNKAYEAFRQACMDRDSAVKELKQKTDSYEKQIREQQDQIESLTRAVAKLKSQLSPLNANRVDTHDPIPVPDNNEIRRNGTLLNLNCDQLHEKLKLAMEREKRLKEQLEIGSIKLKQTEEDNNFKEKEFESVIAVKEDEIRFLKKQLKEISKAQNCTQVLRYEKEAKSNKQASSRQEFSPGSCAATAFERDELETVFWGLTEEFHRIRTLARTQTDQLSKFKLRREPVTEIPFSKPIQCTDEHADDLCNPWVKKDINRDLVPLFPSITPRGMGPDEEENFVESLSKLSVKFPPTDNDSTFLQSTADALPMPCAVGPECLLPDLQSNRELGDPAGNFSDATCPLFDERSAVPFTLAVHGPLVVSKAKPMTHTNVLLQSPLDKAPGFKAPFLNNFGAFPSLDANERTVDASQQPLWKPYHAQDSALLTVASADSDPDQPGICEFCQKVFPPSLTSNEDFLRHLNSHFDKKT
ncbi:TRAF family member-associated NF-kappa-B activator [Heteronotia binoei]|uniref:TRAF family member-associated NF-kappa-B activator n=1 Tax=Heteronotia binoei TaxID=13085 RepID=UPI00292ECC1A|nr:TRAF family member-associated NF-kappa-B activator [Heteronotia binoei]XP_060113055.1 TRAF family member-associated NF-kappa-B activator [Heteronotia binoei]